MLTLPPKLEQEFISILSKSSKYVNISIFFYGTGQPLRREPSYIKQGEKSITMQANQKGKLISWKDDRGFGFIEPETGTKKVFLHISVLKKHGRRPQEGDTIYYQLSFDRQNRARATYAHIEGVQYQVRRSSDFNRREKTSHTRRYHIILVLMIIAIAIVAGGINYSRQSRRYRSSRSSNPVQSASPFSQPTQYQCRGKTYCSQMTSCEEAKFYLRNCSGVKIDGDDDGIPCEDQWCGH